MLAIFELCNFWVTQSLINQGTSVEVVLETTSVTKAVKPTLVNKSCSNKKKCHFIIPILKVSVTKFQGFFLFEQLYVRPLLAIRKGQYWPWTEPVQG